MSKDDSTDVTRMALEASERLRQMETPPVPPPVAPYNPSKALFPEPVMFSDDPQPLPLGMLDVVACIGLVAGFLMTGFALGRL